MDNFFPPENTIQKFIRKLKRKWIWFWFMRFFEKYDYEQLKKFSRWREEGKLNKDGYPIKSKQRHFG